MSHRHNPTNEDNGTLDLRLWTTASLNTAITLAELFGGLFSGSLALLSDAAHNFSDVVAVVLALWARRLSRRPPTIRHTYGFKRIEVMTALANALSLIAVTVLIAREALQRLLHPEPVAQGVMLLVALVALVANVGSVFLLRRHEKNDVNVRSAFLHMAQDALASLAVVVAALLAHTAVGPYVDPVAAFIVGLLVLRSSLSLLNETFSTLIEGAPLNIDIADLADRVGQAFSPARLHHVHLWEIGPGQRLLTAHIVLGQNMDGCEIEAFLARIKDFLLQEWQINHVTLEPEVSGCVNAELLGRWANVGEESFQAREHEEVKNSSHDS